MGTEVVGFKGRSGERLWRTRLDRDSRAADSLISLLHPSSDDSSLFILSASLEAKQVSLTQLAAGTGVVEKEAELPAPWLVATGTSCVIVVGVAVCLDLVTQTLYHGSGDRFLRTDLQVTPFRTHFQDMFIFRTLSVYKKSSVLFIRCEQLTISYMAYIVGVQKMFIANFALLRFPDFMGENDFLIARVLG